VRVVPEHANRVPFIRKSSLFSIYIYIFFFTKERGLQPKRPIP